MINIKNFIFICYIFCFQGIFSQSVKISGIVESNIEIENINVINKTIYDYAITNGAGEFEITANLNDTLQFSSMLHKTKYVVVTENIFSLKVVNVHLEELVNELNEVKIGNTLSGDLLLDIKNIEGEPPINFYDLGIPGYTGKIATQSERQLAQAGEFKPIMLLGLLGGSLPLDPIMNGISGRTKMLKKRVEHEISEDLIQSIKSRLGKAFFVNNPIEEDLIMDFFYFCSDDENFTEYCKNQTDFKILIFLKMKYAQYLENRNESKY